MFFRAIDASPGWFTAVGLICEPCNGAIDIHRGKDQFAIDAQPCLDQVAAIFVFGHTNINPFDGHLVPTTGHIENPGWWVNK